MPNLLRTALAAALLAAATISADYNGNAGTFDHAKFIHGNEGGYKTHKSLNWLPESYPRLEQAGVNLVVITHLLNENFYNIVKRTPQGTLTYDFESLDRIIEPLVNQNLTL